MRKLCAALLSLSLSTSAIAAPCPRLSIDLPQDSIAPCDGVFMDPTTADNCVAAVKDKKVAEERLVQSEAKLKLVEKTCAADLKQAKGETLIERNRRIAAENRVLELTEPESIFDSPVFWGVTMFTVGVVGGFILKDKI